LTGVVSDPSGGVSPGAKVVTDADKAYDYPGTVGAWRYLITNLPPSVYQINAQAPGFKTHTQSGIILNVAPSSRSMLTSAHSAEVTGAAPLLSTQDAVTGQKIDRSMTNDLPLYGRSLLDLAPASFRTPV
jgi:hypothetical protein